MNTPNYILTSALIYAAGKHHFQKRRGYNTPYILHPMRVAAIVYNAKREADLNLLLFNNDINTTMAIALLHDVVEDCDVKVEEIYLLFGKRIGKGVKELTNDNKACKQMGKAEYLLSRMLAMPNECLTIKLADRLDNLRDMAILSSEKRKKTIAETNFILSGLKARRLNSTQRSILNLIYEEIKKA